MLEIYNTSLTHPTLSKRGLRTQSFGSGSCVKLPGPAIDKPNIYSFDTSYETIFKDLKVSVTLLYIL